MVWHRFSRLALVPALAAAALGAASPPCGAATDGPRALLTIADGPVELLRGAARFPAAEGLALADDDIVRTAAGTRVVRIEFTDGRVLDLGPATQVLLLSDAASRSQGLAGAMAVVAQGWVKLGVPAAVNASAGPGARLATSGATVVAPPAGSVLLHAAADGTTLVFAEARAASVWRRVAQGTGALEASLREGEAWVRAAESPSGTVSGGVGLPALQGVPRALADTLPRRSAQFAGRAVEPANGQPLESGDLAPWLRAEPALIEALRPRLAALSRNTATAARTMATAPRKGTPAASTAARTLAARTPSASAARAPKVLAGLTLSHAASTAGKATSPALETSSLLPTVPIQAPLPVVAMAPGPEAASPRPVTARVARAALAASAATLGGADSPKRR